MTNSLLVNLTNAAAMFAGIVLGLAYFGLSRPK
jgi:hypothetical protein